MRKIKVVVLLVRQLQHGFTKNAKVSPNFTVFWGVDFRKSIAEYIMPLYPPFWRPFVQNGGHLQSNTSISETKRRRGFNFDSISRFCGALISEKSIAEYTLPLYPPFWRRFKKKHGAHFQNSMPISETKRY